MMLTFLPVGAVTAFAKVYDRFNDGTLEYMILSDTETEKTVSVEALKDNSATSITIPVKVPYGGKEYTVKKSDSMLFIIKQT